MYCEKYERLLHNSIEEFARDVVKSVADSNLL